MARGNEWDLPDEDALQKKKDLLPKGKKGLTPQAERLIREGVDPTDPRIDAANKGPTKAQITAEAKRQKALAAAAKKEQALAEKKATVEKAKPVKKKPEVVEKPRVTSVPKDSSVQRPDVKTPLANKAKNAAAKEAGTVKTLSPKVGASEATIEKLKTNKGPAPLSTTQQLQADTKAFLDNPTGSKIDSTPKVRQKKATVEGPKVTPKVSAEDFDNGPDIDKNVTIGNKTEYTPLERTKPTPESTTEEAPKVRRKKGGPVESKPAPTATETPDQKRRRLQNEARIRIDKASPPTTGPVNTPDVDVKKAPGRLKGILGKAKVPAALAALGVGVLDPDVQQTVSKYGNRVIDVGDGMIDGAINNVTSTYDRMKNAQYERPIAKDDPRLQGQSYPLMETPSPLPVPRAPVPLQAPQEQGVPPQLLSQRGIPSREGQFLQDNLSQVNNRLDGKGEMLQYGANTAQNAVDSATKRGYVPPEVDNQGSYNMGVIGRNLKTGWDAFWGPDAVEEPFKDSPPAATTPPVIQEPPKPVPKAAEVQPQVAKAAAKQFESGQLSVPRAATEIVKADQAKSGKTYTQAEFDAAVKQETSTLRNMNTEEKSDYLSYALIAGGLLASAFDESGDASRNFGASFNAGMDRGLAREQMQYKANQDALANQAELMKIMMDQQNNQANRENAVKVAGMNITSRENIAAQSVAARIKAAMIRAQGGADGSGGGKGISISWKDARAMVDASDLANEMSEDAKNASAMYLMQGGKEGTPDLTGALSPAVNPYIKGVETPSIIPWMSPSKSIEAR